MLNHVKLNSQFTYINEVLSFGDQFVQQIKLVLNLIKDSINCDESQTGKQA